MSSKGRPRAWCGSGKTPTTPPGWRGHHIAPRMSGGACVPDPGAAALRCLSVGVPAQASAALTRCRTVMGGSGRRTGGCFSRAPVFQSRESRCHTGRARLLIGVWSNRDASRPKHDVTVRVISSGPGVRSAWPLLRRGVSSRASPRVRRATIRGRIADTGSPGARVEATAAPGAADASSTSRSGSSGEAPSSARWSAARRASHPAQSASVEPKAAVEGRPVGALNPRIENSAAPLRGLLSSGANLVPFRRSTSPRSTFCGSAPDRRGRPRW